MAARNFLFTITCTLIFLPCPLFGAVYGQDDRQLIDATQYPYQGVGWLSCYSEISDSEVRSTAFLISVDSRIQRNDFILTVAHAFGNFETGEEYLDCEFFLATDSDRSNGSPVSTVIKGKVFETRHRSDDWAVAILRDNVSHTADFKPLLLRMITRDELYWLTQGAGFIELAGFDEEASGSSGYVFSRASSGCTAENADDEFLSLDPALIVTDCDATGGASGGPLLHISGDSVQVLGIYLGNRNTLELKGKSADGSTFDRKSNINVARRIDSEIIDAATELAGTIN